MKYQIPDIFKLLYERLDSVLQRPCFADVVLSVDFYGVRSEFLPLEGGPYTSRKK